MSDMVPSFYRDACNELRLKLHAMHRRAQAAERKLAKLERGEGQ